MTDEKRLICANEVEEMVGAFADQASTKEAYAAFWKVIHNIRQMPTVDAVEVVHGRWLYDSGSGKYFCSACDEYAISFKKDTLYGGDLYEVCLSDYCPNCGAKMDGDGNA